MSNPMFSAINKNYQGNKDQQGFFLLMSHVSLETIQPVIEWIIDANFSEEPPDVLNLMICTPGGDASAAFALVDVMRGSAIPVRTIGVGEIASCGLIIFMAGQKGNRVLTPNTMILSHQYSWGSGGKDHELIAATKAFNITNTMILNHYKKFTKLSEAQIKVKLLPPSDVWLTSKEALEYGICDIVKELS
ncbi:MAG: ATP-dependent Clp protease proteolytic subunit [Bacilli bacterium]|nr:ATP-dependent Clp protease proteolytic subunit [Bacilli bacterium]